MSTLHNSLTLNQELTALTRLSRLGRLRYFLYSSTIPQLAFVALFPLTLESHNILRPLSLILSNALGMPFFWGILLGRHITAIIAYCAFLVFLTIRRLHDFEYGAWASIVLAFPIINLTLCFIPGSVDSNKFGAAPAPNSRNVWIIAVFAAVLSSMVFPIVFSKYA